MAKVQFIIDSINKEEIIDAFKSFKGTEELLEKIKKVKVNDDNNVMCEMNDFIVKHILIRQRLLGKTNNIYELNKTIYETVTGEKIDEGISELVEEVEKERRENNNINEENSGIKAVTFIIDDANKFFVEQALKALNLTEEQIKDFMNFNEVKQTRLPEEVVLTVLSIQKISEETNTRYNINKSYYENETGKNLDNEINKIIKEKGLEGIVESIRNNNKLEKELRIFDGEEIKAGLKAGKNLAQIIGNQNEDASEEELSEYRKIYLEAYNNSKDISTDPVCEEFAFYLLLKDDFFDNVVKIASRNIDDLDKVFKYIASSKENFINFINEMEGIGNATNGLYDKLKNKIISLKVKENEEKIEDNEKKEKYLKTIFEDENLFNCSFRDTLIFALRGISAKINNYYDSDIYCWNMGEPFDGTNGKEGYLKKYIHEKEDTNIYKLKEVWCDFIYNSYWKELDNLGLSAHYINEEDYEPLKTISEFIGNELEKPEKEFIDSFGNKREILLNELLNKKGLDKQNFSEELRNYFDYMTALICISYEGFADIEADFSGGIFSLSEGKITDNFIKTIAEKELKQIKEKGIEYPKFFINAKEKEDLINSIDEIALEKLIQWIFNNIELSSLRLNKQTKKMFEMQMGKDYLEGNSFSSSMNIIQEIAYSEYLYGRKYTGSFIYDIYKIFIANKDKDLFEIEAIIKKEIEPNIGFATIKDLVYFGYLVSISLGSPVDILPSVYNEFVIEKGIIKLKNDNLNSENNEAVQIEKIIDAEIEPIKKEKITGDIDNSTEEIFNKLLKEKKENELEEKLKFYATHKDTLSKEEEFNYIKEFVESGKFKSYQDLENILKQYQEEKVEIQEGESLETAEVIGKRLAKDFDSMIEKIENNPVLKNHIMYYVEHLEDLNIKAKINYLNEFKENLKELNRENGYESVELMTALVEYYLNLPK